MSDVVHRHGCCCVCHLRAPPTQSRHPAHQSMVREQIRWRSWGRAAYPGPQRNTNLHRRRFARRLQQRNAGHISPWAHGWRGQPTPLKRAAEAVRRQRPPSSTVAAANVLRSAAVVRHVTMDFSCFSRLLIHGVAEHDRTIGRSCVGIFRPTTVLRCGNHNSRFLLHAVYFNRCAQCAGTHHSPWRSVTVEAQTMWRAVPETTPHGLQLPGSVRRGKANLGTCSKQR